MEGARPRPEVNFSMQNLLDPATAYVLLLSLEQQINIAQQAGYTGVEYFPTRSVSYLQTLLGFNHKSLPHIQSLHQNHTRLFAQPHFVLSLINCLLQPFTHASLKHLLSMQQRVHQSTGRDISAIIYASARSLADLCFAKLKHKLIQPTPELVAAWGGSLKTFLAQAEAYDCEICLDLLHIRRYGSAGETLPNWREVIPVLLPQTREVHVAVGRRDFTLVNGDSVQELADLYAGTTETEIIPILAMVRDLGWQGPLVTEIQGTGICELLSVRQPFLSPCTLIHVHREIVSTIKHIMSS